MHVHTHAPAEIGLGLACRKYASIPTHSHTGMCTQSLTYTCTHPCMHARTHRSARTGIPGSVMRIQILAGSIQLSVEMPGGSHAHTHTLSPARSHARTTHALACSHLPACAHACAHMRTHTHPRTCVHTGGEYDGASAVLGLVDAWNTGMCFSVRGRAGRQAGMLCLCACLHACAHPCVHACGCMKQIACSPHSSLCPMMSHICICAHTLVLMHSCPGLRFCHWQVP